MKRLAVVIYDGFCTFEFAVALEALKMSGEAEFTVFGEEKRPYRSEEGLVLLPECALCALDVEKYDGLVLTGFDSEDPKIIKNELFLSQIREFCEKNKLVAAISAAPVFLLRAGVLKNRPFMCAIPREGLLEEGFTEEELSTMLDWDDCIKKYDTLKYLCSGNIITSVAYGYREWAMEICRALGIKFYPKSFGL